MGGDRKPIFKEGFTETLQESELPESWYFVALYCDRSENAEVPPFALEVELKTKGSDNRFSYEHQSMMELNAIIFIVSGGQIIASLRQYYRFFEKHDSFESPLMLLILALFF